MWGLLLAKHIISGARESRQIKFSFFVIHSQRACCSSCDIYLWKSITERIAHQRVSVQARVHTKTIRLRAARQVQHVPEMRLSRINLIAFHLKLDFSISCMVVTRSRGNAHHTHTYTRTQSPDSSKPTVCTDDMKCTLCTQSINMHSRAVSSAHSFVQHFIYSFILNFSAYLPCSFQQKYHKFSSLLKGTDCESVEQRMRKDSIFLWQIPPKSFQEKLDHKAFLLSSTLCAAVVAIHFSFFWMLIQMKFE